MSFILKLFGHQSQQAKPSSNSQSNPNQVKPISVSMPDSVDLSRPMTLRGGKKIENISAATQVLQTIEEESDSTEDDASKPMTLRGGKQIGSSDQEDIEAERDEEMQMMQSAKKTTKAKQETLNASGRLKRKTFENYEDLPIPFSMTKKKVKTEHDSPEPSARKLRSSSSHSNASPQVLEENKEKPNRHISVSKDLSRTSRRDRMKSKIFAKSSLQAPAVKASAESAIRNIPRGFNMPVATAKVNLRGLVLRQFEEANPPMISDAVLQPYLADMEKYGIRPNLKLCKINQEVGNGVFLAPDANPIPENQFIGLYGGEYIVAHSEEDVDSDYLFTVFTDIELQNSELDLIEGARNFETNQFCLEVDGKKKGNFCRYFNHTSAEHANLKFCYVCMKDGSIQIAFYTKKTVYPGEQLMLDYKNEFWRAKKIQPKIETPKTYTLTRRGQIRGS